MTGIIIFKLQNGSHTNVQAHPPDGRGGALNAELRLELENGKFDISAHSVGCRALCVPSMGTVLMGLKSPVDKPDMTKTYS